MSASDDKRYANLLRHWKELSISREQNLKRIQELENERDALAAHVEAGREAVEHARQWVPQHVWTRLWLWKEETPATSLARLKAEMLEEAADQLPNSHPIATGLRDQAAELRRQTEEDT